MQIMLIKVGYLKEKIHFLLPLVWSSSLMRMCTTFIVAMQKNRDLESELVTLGIGRVRKGTEGNLAAAVQVSRRRVKQTDRDRRRELVVQL